MKIDKPNKPLFRKKFEQAYLNCQEDITELNWEIKHKLWHQYENMFDEEIEVECLQNETIFHYIPIKK